MLSLLTVSLKPLRHLQLEREILLLGRFHESPPCWLGPRNKTCSKTSGNLAERDSAELCAGWPGSARPGLRASWGCSVDVSKWSIVVLLRLNYSASCVCHLCARENGVSVTVFPTRLSERLLEKRKECAGRSLFLEGKPHDRNSNECWNDLELLGRKPFQKHEQAAEMLQSERTQSHNFNISFLNLWESPTLEENVLLQTGKTLRFKGNCPLLLHIKIDDSAHHYYDNHHHIKQNSKEKLSVSDCYRHDLWPSENHQPLGRRGFRSQV